MRNANDTAYSCAGCLFLVIVCIAVAAYAYGKLHTEATIERVTALRWQYWINVERYTAVRQDTSRYAMPGDAYDIEEYTSCTGTGKKRSCSAKARYKVNRWRYDYTLTNDGKPGAEMTYPAFTPSPEQVLGAVREGNRGKTYLVDFTGGYTYAAPDFQRWMAFVIERSYRFNVNHFREVDWSTLQEAN